MAGILPVHPVDVLKQVAGLVNLDVSKTEGRDHYAVSLGTDLPVFNGTFREVWGFLGATLDGVLIQEELETLIGEDDQDGGDGRG